MNPPHLLLAVTTAALVAGGGTALAASQPVISPQHTLSGRAPVSVPGTGVHRGDKLPSGARLIYRTVTLASHSQKPEVTLTAPAGTTLKGLAVGNAHVGFVLVRPRDYPGKQKVVVRASLAPKAKPGASGRIYALVR